MQINANVEKRDGSTGNFFHHGTYATPVYATVRTVQGHASTFGYALADRISNIHTNSTLQDAGKMTECPMIKFKEVGK